MKAHQTLTVRGSHIL